MLAVELEQHLLLLAVELGQVKTVSMYVTGFSTVQTGGSKFPRLRVEIGEKFDEEVRGRDDTDDKRSRRKKK